MCGKYLKINRLLSIALFLSWSSACFGQYTIERCQEMARENYPLVRQYGLIERSKEYDLSNASKARLPQFSFTGKATYQTDVTSVPISSFKPIPKDQYQAILQMDQVIWDGGVVHSKKEAAKAAYEVDIASLEVDMYALKERVNSLFFGILLLEEQLKLNKVFDDQLRRNFDDVSAHMAGGTANAADLDAVRAERLTNRQAYVDIDVTRSAYLAMLSAMVGEKVDSLVRPAPGLVNTSVVNRPELALFDAMIKQVEQTRMAISARNTPKLNAFVQGAYGNPGLNLLKPGFTPYAIGGLTLSWNLGGFYTRRNDHFKVGNQHNLILTQMDTFLFNTDQSVIQAQGEIAGLREKIADDERIIELRRNVKTAAEARQRAGTISVNDMLREVISENTAAQNKILHEIELMMAIYNLKLTVGE